MRILFSVKKKITRGSVLAPATELIPWERERKHEREREKERKRGRGRADSESEGKGKKEKRGKVNFIALYVIARGARKD